MVLGGGSGKGHPQREETCSSHSGLRIVGPQPSHDVSPEQPFCEGTCQMHHRAWSWPKSGLSSCVCVRHE